MENEYEHNSLYEHTACKFNTLLDKTLVSISKHKQI